MKLDGCCVSAMHILPVLNLGQPDSATWYNLILVRFHSMFGHCCRTGIRPTKGKWNVINLNSEVIETFLHKLDGIKGI